MDPPLTPFPLSDDENFLSPNSRSSSFHYHNTNDTTSTPARCHLSLSTISPAPSIPNIFDRDGIVPLQPNPRPQHSTPREIEVQHPSSPLVETVDAVAVTVDRTDTDMEDQAVAIDGAEADEAATVDVDAEAATVDVDTEVDEVAGVTDAHVASFLPAEGEGEPIEEAPVKPGRAFCEH